MGKIKGFLFAVRHREILMTDLGLIVPSKCEGFGLVTVEGMLNGSLVVGKDTGGTKEQFDNGKSFCGKEIGLRYNTEKDLVNRLFEVDSLPNKDYTEYIIRAPKTICEFYDIKAQATKLINYYNTLLKFPTPSEAAETGI